MSNFDLRVIFLMCIAARAIAQEVNVSAGDPVIRSIDLKSFGNDIESIASLYNSSWYLVGKCCPVGQLYRAEEGEDPKYNRCDDPLSTEKIEFSPFFSDFNRSGMLIPGRTYSQFVAVIGIPCQYGKFRLEPEKSSSDEYHILANGSVYRPFDYPRVLAPGRDYCMEFIPKHGLSVLVCYQPELKVVTADTRLAFYAVGLLMSVPFLLATIFAYSITPELRGTHGSNLSCYSACLAVAFLTLAILQLSDSSLGDNSCVTLAFVIQFSFVACFFWFNAMTVETWRLIRRYSALGSAFQDEEGSRAFFYYSLWGWGLPAVLIVISIILNLNPTIPWTYVKRASDGAPSCWFGLDTEALPYFYVPVGILVFANATIFAMTGMKIAKTQRDLDLRRLARNSDSDRVERRVFAELRLTFFQTLALFVIIAMNWSMELVSVLTGSNVLAWSVFDFVNALQGILVFGLFVLRKAVRTLVWRRVKELCGIGGHESSSDRINELTLLPTANDASQRMTQ